MGNQDMSPGAQAQGPSTLVRSGYAPVNGLRMYYEVHGREDGVPLLLLHGGGSTIESTFGRVLPHLASRRHVVAIEEQGHGRTSDRDQPVTFEASADDAAALLRHLRIAQADVFGFSNGGNVALQMAIRHPALVRKLVFASALTRRDGAPDQFWEFMRQAGFDDMPQALKDAFLRVNPDPKRLRAMHDKDAARMRAFADVADADVRSVRAPTLVVTGDRDVATPEHAVTLLRLLPDARLLVVPSGHGHYLGETSAGAVDEEYAELTARLVERFLAGTP